MPNEIEKMIEQFKEDHKDDTSIPYMYSTKNRVDPAPVVEMVASAKILSARTPITEAQRNELQEGLQNVEILLQRFYEMNNTVNWRYSDAPYFTDKEVAQRIGIYTEHFHRDGTRHYSNFERVDPSQYRNKVKEIEQLIKSTEDPEEIARLKDNMLALGWNPEVEYTPENVEKAKERITAEYNKEIQEFNFMNLSVGNEVEWYLEHAQESKPVDLIPVVLALYEDGLDVIQPHKVPIKESSTNVDIYVLSVESVTTDEVRVIAEFSTFVLPTNLRAARIAKQLYAEADTDISYPKPIIQKIYHGPMNEVNEAMLNEFIAKSFTFNPITETIPLFEIL